MNNLMLVIEFDGLFIVSLLVLNELTCLSMCVWIKAHVAHFKLTTNAVVCCTGACSILIPYRNANDATDDLNFFLLLSYFFLINRLIVWCLQFQKTVKHVHSIFLTVQADAFPSVQTPQTFNHVKQA